MRTKSSTNHAEKIIGVRYRYAPDAPGWLVTLGVEHEAQASLPMIFRFRIRQFGR
jgi:hypothetical protein